MKREEFEKISEPIFRAIIEVLSKMRDNLKQKNISLHSIELVGGGSRIPAFVSLVKSVFGV
jgi:molecular chaperone DnaK (HSP70)